jgi:hypothetical protein
MRQVPGLLLLALLLLPTRADAADLRAAGPSLRLPPDAYGSPLRYGRLYDPYAPYTEGGPRPHRRVMGGPDYVGSSFGLGKPAYSGIGPRPDWGRSTYD